jgi:hypothetical protein
MQYNTGWDVSKFFIGCIPAETRIQGQFQDVARLLFGQPNEKKGECLFARL